MAALLDAQYGPTSVDEEQEMVVLQARRASLVKHTHARHSNDARTCGNQNFATSPPQLWYPRLLIP